MRVQGALSLVSPGLPLLESLLAGEVQASKVTCDKTKCQIAQNMSLLLISVRFVPCEVGPLTLPKNSIHFSSVMMRFQAYFSPSDALNYFRLTSSSMLSSLFRIFIVEVSENSLVKKSKTIRCRAKLFEARVRVLTTSCHGNISREAWHSWRRGVQPQFQSALPQ